MNDRVLFVDDEPNVLSSIRRGLRKAFSVDTAESGAEALAKLVAGETYAVIVSDMRMPRMSGVEFLAKAKEHAPNTVRMMLTGNADQRTAVEAVNVGDVFRFLNKPCQPDELLAAVKAAIRQHELITAEKELLEQTLRGSIKALADVLALSNPEIFGRASRLKVSMGKLATELKQTNVWLHESVAMLSQLGCSAVSEEVVKRRVSGQPLPEHDMAEFAAHTAIGAELIAGIPRMGKIARAIRYQEKHFDGGGYPQDDVAGNDIPLSARMLKVALDFDGHLARGLNGPAALAELKSRAGRYDPAVLAAFGRTIVVEQAADIVAVEIESLTDTVVLAEDVRAASGVLLVAKGQETSISVRRRLRSFRENGAIPPTVQVESSCG